MNPLLILTPPPLPLAAHAARIMPSAFYAPSPVIGYSGSGPVYNFGQISSTGHFPWMLAEDILKGLGTSSPNHGSWCLVIFDVPPVINSDSDSGVSVVTMVKMFLYPSLCF